MRSWIGAAFQGVGVAMQVDHQRLRLSEAIDKRRPSNATCPSRDVLVARVTVIQLNRI